MKETVDKNQALQNIFFKYIEKLDAKLRNNYCSIEEVGFKVYQQELTEIYMRRQISDYSK